MRQVARKILFLGSLGSDQGIERLPGLIATLATLLPKNLHRYCWIKPYRSITARNN